MKHTIITTTAALALLGACATAPPPPICDREAQEWNKFETQEDTCDTVATPVRPAPTLPNFNKDRPKRPTGGPDAPDPTYPTPTPPVTPPVVEPPVVQPPEDEDDKPKGDNSDANGKGGNKHDREDFTHGGTETAEDKKD